MQHPLFWWLHSMREETWSWIAHCHGSPSLSRQSRWLGMSTDIVIEWGLDTRWPPTAPSPRTIGSKFRKTNKMDQIPTENHTESSCWELCVILILPWWEASGKTCSLLLMSLCRGGLSWFCTRVTMTSASEASIGKLSKCYNNVSLDCLAMRRLCLAKSLLVWLVSMYLFERRRAIIEGRAVRVNTQLKSHKRFADAFRRYCLLVDGARLYRTDAMGGSPAVTR